MLLECLVKSISSIFDLFDGHSFEGEVSGEEFSDKRVAPKGGGVGGCANRMGSRTAESVCARRSGERRRFVTMFGNGLRISPGIGSAVGFFWRTEVGEEDERSIISEQSPLAVEVNGENCCGMRNEV